MATNNCCNFEVVNTSGNQTFPNQPGFAITNNAYVNNVTGDGTLYSPVQMNNELLDRGSNFASNVFTASVAGIYVFSANIMMSGDFSGTHDGICSIITTTKTYSTYFNPAYWAATSGVDVITMRCLIICYMNASDTSKVGIQIDNRAKDLDCNGDGSTFNTTFTGYLLA
jgi:hypothetical protein